MKDRQKQLIQCFDSLLPAPGVLATNTKGLRLFRVDEAMQRRPFSYEPQIIIMVQGQKLITLHGREYLYDPFHYVVLSVPLPLECTVVLEKNKPVLGLSITIDPASIGEILLEDESIRTDRSDTPRGIYSSPLPATMLDATCRLLQVLAGQEDAPILSPMIVREIMYRVLRDEHGWALQALALQNRGFFQIARVLMKIQKSYDAEFDVKSLAREAGMSPTTFHTSFKHITGSSPLQYIKHIRLHKARELMSAQSMSAYAAAHRVGYESPSQFSREYKRLFGATPAKDVMVLVEG